MAPRSMLLFAGPALLAVLACAEEAAIPEELAQCGAQGGAEACGFRAPTAKGGVPKLAAEHLLLQHRKVSIASVEQEGSCHDLPNVEKVCGSNGCRVLATEVRGQTCKDYCAKSGRSCVSAAEEVDETCQVKQPLRCNETYGTTSDLLCECSSEVVAKPENPHKDSCVGMQDVEKVCSDNACKVLATNMRGKTCKQYCEKNGRQCVSAAEEVAETCQVKEQMQCDQTWGWTSDLLCECSTTSSGPVAGVPSPSGLRLVWSDEFDGTYVDPAKWSLVMGGGGFGNKELQYYTDRPSNVIMEHGILKITAKCEHYKGEHFTSAKMFSKGKGDWGPGHRVDVRAKVPRGKGAWPAIWMLPTEETYGGWPRSGEIDIMESVGCKSDTVYGTVHTKAYNHRKNTQKMNDVHEDLHSWHTYSVVWTASEIKWYVDGNLYHHFSNEHSSDKWPFDQRFYLILNVAVGGSWGGMCLHGRPSCHSGSEFGHDQVMEVDYARVYAL